jgi:hypothetical protein
VSESDGARKETQPCPITVDFPVDLAEFSIDKLRRLAV